MRGRSVEADAVALPFSWAIDELAQSANSQQRCNGNHRALPDARMVGGSVGRTPVEAIELKWYGRRVDLLIHTWSRPCVSSRPSVVCTDGMTLTRLFYCL